MPKLSEIRHEVLVVDGQSMILPREEEWDKILGSPKIGGERIWASYLLKGYLETIRPFPELVLALLSHGTMGWQAIELLKAPYGWQRIRLFPIRCDRCEFESLAGDAWLSDLYLFFSTEDWRACMKRAREVIGVKNCPQCGEFLRGAPIWLAKGA